MADGEQNSDLHTVDYSGGLKPMTEDEIRLKEETSVLATGVRLNDIALERINEQLKKNGQPEVSYDTAEIGEEMITAENDIMQFSTSDVKSFIPLMEKADNTKDERTSKYFPPYKKQGSFGSCGAFSSTYYQMTYTKAFTKREPIDEDMGKVLSPKFTYNIGKKSDDGEEGLWPSTAYAIVQKHGCPSYKDFEYNIYDNLSDAPASEYRSWLIGAEKWKNALQNKVKQSFWSNIGDPNEATPVKSPNDEHLNFIKELLLCGYILNVVTPTGWKMDTASNGEEICVEVISGEKRHAMTVVGYDDNVTYELDGVQGKGAFKLLDSQSNKPDEVWFAYDAINAKSAIYPDRERLQGWINNEFTWVTMYANYSPKLLAEFKITTNNRGAVDLSLGYGDILSDKPTELWKPFIFNETKYIDDNGGNNCFNINGIYSDEADNSATIVLDFTDLINEKETDRLDKKLKWYLSSNADISDFKLIDMRPENGEVYTCLDTLPNDTGLISVPFLLPMKVNKDKVWNISVNYPLNGKTVNAKTVAVKNNNGENIIAPVSLKNDREIVVMPRGEYTVGEYTPGEYYSLEIDGIKTVAGNGLKMPIIKYFYVAPDNEETVDYSIESSFTDSNFLKVIRKLAKKPNGVVCLSDVRDIKELDVSNSDITNLEGIEYFTSLEKLNCSNNQITQLDLSRNINLTTLDVSNNKLTELDLSHNTLLTDVNVNGNDLNPTLVGFKINNGYDSSSDDYNDYINDTNEYGSVIDLLDKDSLPKINFVGKKLFAYVKLENSIFVDKLIFKMSTNDENAEIKNESIVLTHVGNGIFTGISSGAYGDVGLSASVYDGNCEIIYTKKHDDLHKEITLGAYEVKMVPGV